MTCCFKTARPHRPPEGSHFLVPGIWCPAGGWRVQASHGCVGRWHRPFSDLPSWAVGQMSSWESPLLPNTSQSCSNHLLAFSFLTHGFSFWMPKLPHCFVGVGALLRVPGEGTGHKGWNWEVSFGGAMLPDDPARPPLLHMGEAWCQTMLQPDFPPQGLKGLFIPLPLCELKTRTKTFKWDSQAPAVSYLWVLQRAWCQAAICYLSGTFTP